MKLKDPMLSEISQPQKDKYYKILFEKSKIVKFTEPESRSVAARASGARVLGSDQQ